MSETRNQILQVLAELGRIYPDMRFGQLVENVAMWAHGPGPEATYDVEDEAFLRTAQEHLKKRLAQLQEEPHQQAVKTP